jgi:hypothetical protein
LLLSIFLFSVNLLDNSIDREGEATLEATGEFTLTVANAGEFTLETEGELPREVVAGELPRLMGDGDSKTILTLLLFESMVERLATSNRMSSCPPPAPLLELVVLVLDSI